jgi:LuxR family maltose regulon positive regulatory protein
VPDGSGRITAIGFDAPVVIGPEHVGRFAVTTRIAVSDADDPGLILKASAPRVPQELLMRRRLSMESSGLGATSGILLQAPAGFGKTSLLAQWRRECVARGAVVAWLTLDASDDALRFVRALTLSLQSANPRSPRSIGDGATALDRLTHWLAGVAEMGLETVLILDDAEALPEATTTDSLLYVLRNAPANLGIIVASRGPLKLPVSDLVAHGRMTTVSTEALRFTLDETIALLSSRFGERIDVDDCARLHDVTEGWPLGLQLAAAAISRQAQSLHDAIQGISARTADIERYFVDCLISRLTPQLSDCLVRISAVDQLHPDLCRAMTALDDAGVMLQQLSRSTPIFIESSDGEWLRIHPLARQFLAARFEQLPQAERYAVHERAAEWLSTNGMYEEAARQAMRVGQHAAVWDLLERSLFDVLVSGHRERVLAWLERLPRAEVAKRPRLRHAVSFALALGARYSSARDLVGGILEDPQSPPIDRFEAALVCAAGDFFADDIDRASATISPWLDQAPAAAPLSMAILANTKAALALFGGAPEKARYQLDHSPRYTDSPNLDYISGLAEWLRGFSYVWEGKVALGERILRPALQRAEEDIGRRSPVGAMLAATLSAALWNRDQPEQAATVLANQLDAIERAGPPDTVITAYQCAARLAMLRNDERGAVDLLEYLFALGDARNIPRLCIASLTEQIRMHARRARAETCASLLARLTAALPAVAVERAGLLGPLIALAADVAAAHVAIARRDWSGALPFVERAGTSAERLRRGRESIEMKLLRALAMREQGRDGTPLFVEALSVASSWGLERIAADTHPALAEWASQVTHLAGDSAQETAKPGSSRPLPARAPTAGLLTPKETDVLQLVARNLSNKQIARALGIGDETVKWHLKNLFGKLNAGAREHLVARARMLGLLTTSES